MKMLTPFLIGTAALFCCQPVKTNDIEKTIPAKTLLNIAYGTDSLQRMDVYLPANRSADSTPVLVMIHGGGWVYGDKAEFATAIAMLQKELPQYAIVNLNYRLANHFINHFPTQEQDVQAALHTVVKAAADYGISKNFVLLGTSAGAHLALLQAYKYNTPIVPKAVISFFGPSDMAMLYKGQSNGYYKSGLQLLIGGTPATKPELFEQASPINFAGRQNVPTLLLHGSRDGVVPVDQSKALKAKLEAEGIPVELVLYPNEGHGWQGATLADSYERMKAFLNKHVAHVKQ